jgi:hypothetical protein
VIPRMVDLMDALASQDRSCASALEINPVPRLEEPIAILSTSFCII